MVEAFQNLNFRENSLLLFFAHEVLIHYFDSALGLGPQMATLPHLPISPRTQHMPNLILVTNIFVLIKMVEYHLLVKSLQTVQRYLGTACGGGEG